MRLYLQTHNDKVTQNASMQPRQLSLRYIDSAAAVACLYYRVFAAIQRVLSERVKTLTDDDV